MIWQQWSALAGRKA